MIGASYRWSWLRAAVKSCLTLGAIWMLSGCSESKGPEASSETHWLCESSTECEAYDPKAACVGGYCEDESGERLLASLKPDEADASGGAGGGGIDAQGGSPDVGGAAGANDSLEDAGAMGVACTESPETTAAEDVHEGSYLVTTLESLQTAASLTEITGDLEVGSRLTDAVPALALPNLKRLGGDLMIQGAALEQLSLPNLVSVGGSVSVTQASRLVETDLRRLRDVAGDMFFTNNAQHARIRLDSLSSVGGELTIDDPQLAACELEAIHASAGVTAPNLGREGCTCVSSCLWLEVDCP